MKQYILKAKSTGDCSDKLTKGKLYRTLFGKEPGIFEDRPFATVIADDSKKFSCHFSRFEIHKICSSTLKNNSTKLKIK